MSARPPHPSAEQHSVDRFLRGLLGLLAARPVGADRGSSRAEDKSRPELRRHAPDFMDWVSFRVACPEVYPAFWAANLRAAVRALAPGVSWLGPGRFETVLRAAFPHAECREITSA